MITDVQSIMGSNPSTPTAFPGFPSGSAGPKKPPLQKNPVQRKPEGMARELYNLLTAENRDIQSMMPTPIKASYRKPKAQIGMRAARRYKWAAFENQARADSLKLFHWEREDKMNSGEPYIFSKFNKVINIPTYTADEYAKFLKTAKWSREETDYLFELCRRYDLRWIIIHDRYDVKKFGVERSVEDMKERYYSIVHELTMLADPSAEPICYDAEHERRRKEQMCKLYDRTREEIEEEKELVDQMKIIEARKRDREKKAQDLQKLISMGDLRDSPSPGGMSPVIKSKKSGFKSKLTGPSNGSAFQPGDVAVVPLRFTDFRTAGAHLRSHEMKLPTNVGQKKLKNIEVVLEKCQMEMNPMGGEKVVQAYNDFRSNIVLLQELKSALASAEFELESIRNKMEQEGRHLEIEARTRISTIPEGGYDDSVLTGDEEAPTSKRRLVSYIDHSNTVGNPGMARKRRTTAAPVQIDTRRRKL